MISVDYSSNQWLQKGTAYIWATATAQTGYVSERDLNLVSAQSGYAFDLEQLAFQRIGNGNYLYNVLVGPGQTLVINQLDAEVTPSP
jgi:hypothetical protein